MRLAQRVFTREFKILVCEAIESGVQTQAQASREHNLFSNVIGRWLREYRTNPTGCFMGAGKYPVNSNRHTAEEMKIKELEAALGRATYENQILKEANALLKKASMERRFTK